MQLICHNCGSIIEAEEVNIATDMAKCTVCNSLHRASTLLEKVSVTDLMALPQPTTLQMEQGRYNSIVLRLPVKGVTANTIFVICFATFWLGFVAVWTGLAAMGSPFFALFSLPFWFAGIMMVKGVIIDIKEVQQVTFNKEEVVIEFVRPIKRKTTTISREAIIDVKLDTVLGPKNAFRNMEVRGTGNNYKKGFRENPAIVTQGKTHYFFESLTEPEKQWVVRLLRHTLLSK